MFCGIGNVCGLVYCFFVGIFRYWVLLGIGRGVVGLEIFGIVDIFDYFGFQEFFGFFIVQRGQALIVYYKDGVRGFLGINQFLAFFNVVYYWFFIVDVFVCFYCINVNGFVLVVGCVDDDYVYVFVFQNVFVVFGQEKVLFLVFFSCFKLFVVEVIGCNDVYVFVFQCGIDIYGVYIFCFDYSDIQCLFWCRVLFRF